MERQSLSRLVRGEFHKLFTTRLWLWLLLASLALTALYASLLIAFSDGSGTWTPPLDTAPGQQTLFAVAAGGTGTLAAVLAAIGVTGEFRHRTATVTFLATPHRGRVVTAKLLAYASVGAAFAVLGLGVVTAIALPWLSAKGIGLSLTAHGIPGTALGVLASVTLFSLIGAGLGALLRDQVATVVALLVYRFVAEPILTGVPALEAFSRYLPGPSSSALTQITLTTQEFLQPWAGGLLLTGYGLTFALLGTVWSVRRDIT
ncbi:ABC transporter permease [Streptomyces sp. TRM66268-LWL]|uniref:ABC transporter permease n=1 Tax=Streptomyces polyasparticus TaxID=2767826 RepID=A0ABR7SJE0_9ACTN|nr:ABC transporter permease [Streptomyces polyasparticus]MBC9714702.1 ABC transporter permease [Streptomyces polyasparticus]